MGANATINGPTIDYQTFLSGRGVATNYTSAADNAAFVASFGLQYDHPAGFAGQAPFAGAAPHRRDRLDQRAGVVQPGQGDATSRPGLRHRQVRSQRLLFDSRNDGKVNYDRVLFSTTKDGNDGVGTLAEGKWADVKVKVSGGSLDGKTAGMLVKVERLAPISPRFACSTRP